MSTSNEHTPQAGTQHVSAANPVSSSASSQAADLREHNEQTYLISTQKYAWWCTPMALAGGGLINPRIAILLSLMSRLGRPTNPGESLFAGYIRQAKFHDHEPAILVGALLSLDSQFFAAYPTRTGQPPDHKGMRVACGHAAAAFLKWGTPGAKHRALVVPAVTPDDAYDAAIEAAVTQAQARAQAEVVPEPVSEPEAGSEPEPEAVTQAQARPEPEPEPEPSVTSV